MAERESFIVGTVEGKNLLIPLRITFVSVLVLLPTASSSNGRAASRSNLYEQYSHLLALMS